MQWQEVEKAFHRALTHAISKKKFLFISPLLLASGLLVVFCRAASLEAHSWIFLSLAFLPIFFITGVFLAGGVFITRIYYNEIREQPLQLWKLLQQSLQQLLEASYLSIPLIIAYLCLWALLGVFYLLRAIPGIGGVMSILFSFGPFLLVSSFLMLAVISLLSLFFVTPHIALKGKIHLAIAEEIFSRLKASIFSNTVLFFLGLMPIVLSTGFLTLAAIVTDMKYLTGESLIGISFEWFFIMVPFSLLLTPAVIFFFNFATESFLLLQKKKKGTASLAEEECVPLS
jgi:hypothetical protein